MCRSRDEETTRASAHVRMLTTSTDEEDDDADMLAADSKQQQELVDCNATRGSWRANPFLEKCSAVD